jgi:hypothetical protein
MVKLGPILKFLGCQNNTWGVSALVVLVLQGSACSAVALAVAQRHCASGSAFNSTFLFRTSLPKSRDT